LPEIPDLTVYVEHLRRRLAGQRLVRVRIASPFVLRTVAPAPEAFAGRELVSVERIAKQIALGFEGEHWMVIHLMISGRLDWRDAAAKPPSIPARVGLLALDFEPGTLLFTEASGKKRASIRLVDSRAALRALDPGGLEVLSIGPDAFAARLQTTNHTLKRALTDQHVFAGIGNAYSDEILHRAGLSPFQLARGLDRAEADKLYAAVVSVLEEWTERLRHAAGVQFPKRVTAFHKEMAVHGKYREPCPVCGAPVQRIRYAENDSNYCARCQTGGKVLADRSLSRLMKADWPKRIEELE
jgi:formamidopyrimidine-DNA glycosylase